MDVQNQNTSFILTCCKALIHNIDLSQHEVGNSISTPNLLVDIREHRLELLVYHMLQSKWPNQTAENFLKLKSKSLHIIYQQLHLSQVLIDIHLMLKRADMKHVFLKGPPLNSLLYGKSTYRYSKDIDVLVQRENVLDIDTQLRKMGYHCQNDAEEIKWHLKANTKQDVIYKKPKSYYTIEVHWKADYLDRVLTSNAEWIQDIMDLSFYDEKIPVLKPYKNVLYLCFHGAKHGWNRLFWLLDIVLFIQKYQMDRDALIRYATSYRMESSVFEMIFLASQLFELDWQQQIQQKHHHAFKNAKKRCARKQQKMKEYHILKRGGSFANLWHANYKADRHMLYNIRVKFKLIFLVGSNIIIRVFHRLQKKFTKNIKPQSSHHG